MIGSTPGFTDPSSRRLPACRCTSEPKRIFPGSWLPTCLAIIREIESLLDLTDPKRVGV